MVTGKSAPGDQGGIVNLIKAGVLILLIVCVLIGLLDALGLI
jgi:hypothetical protein